MGAVSRTSEAKHQVITVIIVMTVVSPVPRKAQPQRGAVNDVIGTHSDCGLPNIWR